LINRTGFTASSYPVATDTSANFSTIGALFELLFLTFPDSNSFPRGFVNPRGGL
jgi:hypothetical protein